MKSGKDRGLALFLALGIFALCVYSHFESEEHLPYLSIEDIVSDYRLCVGKKINIWGTITAASENTCTISAKGMEFTTRALPAKIGDLAEIFGTLEENYHISVEEFLIYDRLSYYSIFLRSLAGAAVLCLIFFTSWKPKKLGFVEVEHA